MNDDDLLQKAPVKSPADDGDEPEVRSSQVFDISDDGISPVRDEEEPVTADVRKQVFEALKNPLGMSMKTPTPPKPATPAPVTPPKPITPQPTPVQNVAPKTTAPQNTQTPPISRTPPTTIPHPKIDQSMSTPSVRVYSQIPQNKDSATPINPAPKNTPPATSTIQLQPTPAIKVPSTPKIPEPNSRIAAATNPSLQEILAKVHKNVLEQSPNMTKGDLLDSKIGNFESSPFTNPAQGRPMSPIPPVQPKEVSSAPLVQVRPAQTAPANPPTKNIGVSMSDYTADKDTNTTKSASLQDALADVLPSDKKPKLDSPISSLGVPVTPKDPSKMTPDELASSKLKPIRTYEGDIAEIMSHKRTSTASIVIAESKKNEGQEKISTAKTPRDYKAMKQIAMIVLSLVLVGGGAIGAYYLYSKSALAPVSVNNNQNQNQVSIIPADSKAKIEIDTSNPNYILAQIKNEVAKQQSPNSIKDVILTAKNTSGNVGLVSAPDIIRAMGITAPDILLRSLLENWMFGVYSDTQGQKSAFVIVTTNFFQNAFAGMLQWENVMADDLKQYIPTPDAMKITDKYSSKNLSGTTSTISAGNSLAGATSTGTSNKSVLATSTPVEIVQPLQPYYTLRGKFEDRIVKNKDVRVFRTDTGKILFLYSFIGNSHLVITDNETTLAEILTRVEKQAFIR